MSLKLSVSACAFKKNWCCLCRNLENTERPVYAVKAHSQIVNAIDGVGGLGIGEGAPEIVTGSRDGKIRHKSCWSSLLPVYFLLKKMSDTVLVR